MISHATNLVRQLINKAPGIENLPTELFKHGGDVIINKLTELGVVIWSSDELRNKWTKGCIVKLPKKGSLCNCDNCSGGITLLTIARKFFCRVLLMRLRKEIDLKLILDREFLQRTDIHIVEYHRTVLRISSTNDDQLHRL